MKKRFLSLVLTVAMLLSMLPQVVVKGDAAGYESAWFPAPTMNLTQLPYEAWSGTGSNTGASHGNCNAIDLVPGGNAFAPFTGKIVYMDANWGYVLLQSLDKVYYGDGRLDYMTVAFMHDSDISNLYVGQVINQGTDFYQAGGMGGGNPSAYAAHIDLSVYRGKISSPPDGYGKGNAFAYDAFYINHSKTTQIINKGKVEAGNYITTGGYSDWSNLWRDLPTGVTVMFDANGGVCTTTSLQVPVGGTLSSLPTAIWSGYSFDGWFTERVGGTQVTTSTVISSNMTVYAHWSEAEAVVRFHNASGSVWKTQSVRRGSTNTLQSEYPKVSGSYFCGWSYKAQSSTFDVRPGQIIAVLRNAIDLYPVYVTHEQATSGKPVFIYNIDDFSTSGYSVQKSSQTTSVRIDTSYWKEWSEYTQDVLSGSETRDVENAKVYKYYYFLCPRCGAHEPFWGYCDCGAPIAETAWAIKWSTVPYSQCNYQTYSYTQIKYWTTSLGDGQKWNFSSGNVNDTEIGTIDASGTDPVIVMGYRSRDLVEQYGTSSKAFDAYTIKPLVTYTVRYDANGGSGAPGPQTKTQGVVLRLSSQRPVWSGHTFLGWAKDRSAVSAVYQPDGVYTDDADATLYAVWKEDAPTLLRIEVSSMPRKTVYTIGENLDTAGLALKLTYSNNTTKTVSDGFTTENFSSATAGTKIVTVRYLGLTTTFQVVVNAAVPENAPRIEVLTSSAQAGKQVAVTIRVKNNPGITSLKLTVTYDPALTLEKVTYNEAIGGMSMQPQYLKSPVILNWINGLANTEGDWVFATLTFRIADGAQPGLYPVTVTYNPNDVFNIDEENISFAITNGGVMVTDLMTGDVNGDGVIDNKDLTRLFQYLSQWSVETESGTLDINGDGAIDNKDLTRLFQYLSGWEIGL